MAGGLEKRGDPELDRRMREVIRCARDVEEGNGRLARGEPVEYGRLRGQMAALAFAVIEVRDWLKRDAAFATVVDVSGVETMDRALAAVRRRVLLLAAKGLA